jgi:hypothetical protein
MRCVDGRAIRGPSLTFLCSFPKFLLVTVPAPHCAWPVTPAGIPSSRPASPLPASCHFGVLLSDLTPVGWIAFVLRTLSFRTLSFFSSRNRTELAAPPSRLSSHFLDRSKWFAIHRQRVSLTVGDMDEAKDRIEHGPGTTGAWKVKAMSQLERHPALRTVWNSQELPGKSNCGGIPQLLTAGRVLPRRAFRSICFGAMPPSLCLVHR